MARFTSWRVGAVVVAVGLLVAACSEGGGGSANSSTGGAVGTASNAAPTGIGGGSGSAAGSKTASKTAKASGSKSASRGNSSTPAHASSSSRHSGGGGSHSSSSAPPPDNGCRSSAPPLASDPSKASITVCKAVGLRTTSSDCPRSATPCAFVTITGHSFKPNESLVVAECRYKGEDADNYGLGDCNIKSVLTFAPAKTTKSDGSGHVGPITVPVVDAFKTVNCRTSQCLISVAVPLQSSAADNPHVLISFA